MNENDDDTRNMNRLFIWLVRSAWLLGDIAMLMFAFNDKVDNKETC